METGYVKSNRKVSAIVPNIPGMLNPSIKTSNPDYSRSVPGAFKANQTGFGDKDSVQIRRSL